MKVSSCNNDIFYDTTNYDNVKDFRIELEIKIQDAINKMRGNHERDYRPAH